MATVFVDYSRVGHAEQFSVNLTGPELAQVREGDMIGLRGDDVAAATARVTSIDGARARVVVLDHPVVEVTPRLLRQLRERGEATIHEAQLDGDDGLEARSQLWLHDGGRGWWLATVRERDGDRYRLDVQSEGTAPRR
ncbi:hypothetical protein ER308_04475 [Egibacter rhizosphaerae]|uniref:Uncharacterized protein n=1 Tax=Egibacter rhizosphaerae TaxID=1670831 RepID=A0A411YCI3_9ACTN|nr:hypothetical protein [Egibacter rhizosphaerae]QBI18872.1 hypothetical protein ER308_04475 [Egibacter rhizosphaerae]